MSSSSPSQAIRHLPFADPGSLARSLARSSARAALRLLSSLRRFVFDLVMVASSHQLRCYPEPTPHGSLVAQGGRLGVLNVSRFAVLLGPLGNRARRSKGPAPNVAHLVLEYRLRFIRQDRAAYRAFVELGSAGHGEPTFLAPGSFRKPTGARLTPKLPGSVARVASVAGAGDQDRRNEGKTNQSPAGGRRNCPQCAQVPAGCEDEARKGLASSGLGQSKVP